MALSNSLTRISLTAGVDFSQKQYHFVKQDTSKELTGILAVNNGAGAIGVAQNNPVAGLDLSVATDGISKVAVGDAALAVGDDVTSDANGKAIKATSGATVLGKIVIAAASGGIASIEIYNAGVLA